MARGRPVKSQIRQNVVEILDYMKEGYGYDIYKAYISIFPHVTMRSIYYHLRKGVATKEFKISQVKTEKGKYSWGSSVEKIYYALSDNAKAKGNERVKKYFTRKK